MSIAETDLHQNRVQENEEEEEEATRTLLELLTTEKMDGSDSTIIATTPTEPRLSRWGAVKQRFGLKGIICCSGGWGLHSTALLPEYDNIDDDEDNSPATVNLATALAEERQLRQLTTTETVISESENVPETPTKVSLMRLMAEAAMEAGEEEEEEKNGRSCCCVCMERKKGAALITCGHTFCRVCSRELWLHRGSCPLCNRPILDVLDIF